MTTLHRTLFTALVTLLLAGCAGAQDQYEESTAYAPVEGGQIEYVVSGPEDGETIVFVHGGFVADSFLPIMREPVLANFRKVRVHRMNYMGSFGAEAQTGPAAQSTHIINVLDHLGVDRAHLVGHSAGGRVAHGAAYMFPERVKSLVLAEGYAIPDSLFEEQGVDLDALAARAYGEEGGPTAENRATQQALYEAGDREAAMGMQLSGLLGEDWRDLFASIPNGLQQALGDFFRERVFARPGPAVEIDVAEIEQPTLVLWGQESRVDLKTLGSIAPGILNNARGVEIPETDHALIVQKPAEIAQLIAEFVAENE